MGLAATPFLLAAQSSVLWDGRGVVTGTNLFGRSMGSAVGVAIFGAIASGITAHLPRGENNRAGVVAATTAVYLDILVAAGATVAAAFLIPKVTVDATHQPAQ